MFTNLRQRKKITDMKRLLFIVALCLPLLSMAKKHDDTPYLKGAVPEQNGIVTFQKTFKVPNKSKQAIYQIMKPWLQKLVDESIPAPGNYARMNMDTPDTLVAKVCEYQVYTKKFLNLDRSRYRYTLSVVIDEGKVTITQSGLAWYYSEDQEGNNGIIYRAEEWINDKYALNKAGTKLLPRSGKFRRKTVDRANELFESAMDAFEPTPAQQPAQQPVKKVRTGVVEE